MASVPPPDDNLAYRFPVSIKGVIFDESKVILLKNGRNEWELPGGKLDPDETPETCVAREIEEELGLKAKVGPILDSWVYRITDDVLVLIVTYGCTIRDGQQILISSEHKEVGLFYIHEVNSLNMPEGYKKSIHCWFDTRKE